MASKMFKFAVIVVLLGAAHGQTCNGPASEAAVGSCSYNQFAEPCPQGSVCDQCVSLNFNLCDVPSNTNGWIPGANVLSNCFSIPAYTPVATFNNGVYDWQNNLGHSGVFTRCIDSNNFEVIDQWCESLTKKTVYPRGGYSGDSAFVFRTSAENYYVITG